MTIDSVSLPMGRVVPIAGVGTMMLTDVAAESRCPSDVQCVWAGDATIVLTVCPTGCTAPMAMRINLTTDPRVATVDGVRVSALRLLPLPRAGTVPRREEYVALVRVER
ncbi:MAG: hypothetical protein MUE41_15205 [Gemmatimonadaceae bacterium]|nr:hypothetical protein [Gemmatimonadaceae bacterium]